jgi:hypothetical protein
MGRLYLYLTQSFQAGFEATQPHIQQVSKAQSRGNNGRSVRLNTPPSSACFPYGIQTKKLTIMKNYGGVVLVFQTFLTWPLQVGDWSPSSAGTLLPNKDPPVPTGSKIGLFAVRLQW